MKKTLNPVDQLIEEVLAEQQWNKEVGQRDYSKEYNPPGSKEQEERNKRKRDKRKHDKEFGKCPDNQDLHHVDGVENDKVKCEPPYINRGRKEKSRLKDGEIVIRITEEYIKQIIQEETEEVLSEIFPALAQAAMKGAALAGRGLAAGAKAAGKATASAAKLGAKAAKGAGKAAVNVTKSMAKDAATSLAKDAVKKIAPQTQKLAQKIGGTDVGSYQNLEDMIDQVLQQASDEKLKGTPTSLITKLKTSLPYLKQLKEER